MRNFKKCIKNIAQNISRTFLAKVASVIGGFRALFKNEVLKELALPVIMILLVIVVMGVMLVFFPEYMAASEKDVHNICLIFGGC
jgi:phosphoribosylaminoimidazole (AIR) synthetase